MEYHFPLVATNRGGETRIFNDAESFRVFAFDASNGGVGAYWMESYSTLYGFGSRKLYRNDSLDWAGAVNSWIVRDDRGKPVDKEHFYVSSRHRYWLKRQSEVRHAMEKGLPIPGLCLRRRRSSRKWTKNGRNGAHNQRKGIRLYEDPIISRGDFDDL